VRHCGLVGGKITVTRTDGSKPVFRVTRVAQFPKSQFPTTLVYANIVVFADFVAPPR
jgi:hypothetical protein